jgi:hypothetical protein
VLKEQESVRRSRVKNGKEWERTLKGRYVHHNPTIPLRKRISSRACADANYVNCRLEKRRQAMLEMPKMIATWKERGHGRGWKKWPK